MSAPSPSKPGFMQRAAYSSPNNKTATEAIKAATAEEDARREAATLALRPKKQSSGDAETRWELSYVRSSQRSAGMKVVNMGFAQLGEDEKEEDDEEEEEVKEEKETTGRMVFGNFRKKNFEEGTPRKGEDGSDDSDSSEEEEEENTPRRKKDPLKGLTGISNAGRAGLATMKCHSCGKNGHKSSDCPKAECYACGGRGHMSNDCPNPKKKRRNDGGDSWPRKARKSM
ncbi:hypothetical protein BZA05DRAFT_443729 [Tricharina praecox]|uniref:uncharacterized protein n=1 Tax=Tricharina praecox TaxID=43433 RepID=UPI00221E8C79|nr:uncharacterized protein BZA05DRAFT_443729 [Tricharina praecox]KAI5854213.1 hypothetical protein BZA05DRAFT_443729 [Tricharina praecox]